jgi:hypothetical protein
MEFGLASAFTDHLQAVTTNNYNTVADFHTTNHSTLNLLSVLSLVFVTPLNIGYSSAMFSLPDSWQWTITVTLQISLYSSTHKVFKSHAETFKSALACTQ